MPDSITNDRILELSRAGISRREVARLLGVSKGSVDGVVFRHRMKHGELVPAGRPVWLATWAAPVVEPAPEPVEAVREPVDYFDAGDGDCRWLLRQKGAHGLPFVCGAPVHKNLSYCVEHARRAFTAAGQEKAGVPA